MKSFLPAVLAVLMLSACSSPTVPDMTYYRLPPPSGPMAAKLPSIPIPIDVSVFAADGLYSEQAVIYTPETEGPALKSYHYQLWIDPPARLLQRRLIGVLRQAKVAPLVTDRLPASTDALRITGLIVSFDRAKKDGSWVARVAVQLRVERKDVLLSERAYHVEIPAASQDLKATIDAFGKAMDQIYGEFMTDLAALDVAVK